MFTAVKKRIPDGRRADAESFHTDNAIVTSVVDHMPIGKKSLVRREFDRYGCNC